MEINGFSVFNKKRNNGLDPFSFKLETWFDYLFNLSMSMFRLTTNRNDIDASQLTREMMIRLITSGVCGFLDMGEDVQVAFAYPFKTTNYYDIYRNFSFRSPYHSGNRKNGKNGVLVYLLPSHEPFVHIIGRYAELIAHIETTIECRSINLREPENLIVANNDSSKSQIANYRNNIIKGIFMPLVSKGLIELGTLPATSSKSSGELKDLQESKALLIDEFYHLIGVKTDVEKKANLITEELDSGNTTLEYNLDMMFDEVNYGIKQVNKVFGLDLELHLNRKGL